MPIDVLHDKNLTHTERYLLMDITTLDKLELGCIASNEYFAKLLQMSKPNISRALNSLEEKGYISMKIIDGSRNHQRVIKMIFKGYQNDTEGLSKREEAKGTKSITKSITIPDGINEPSWKEWEQHRKELKKTLTNSTRNKQWKFLLSHKNNQVEIIDQSIQNGWTGLFEVKKSFSNAREPEVGSIEWNRLQAQNEINAEVL